VGYYWSVVVDAQRPHQLYASIAGHGVEQISIEPDLELIRTAAPTSLAVGSNARYSFRVRNAGPFAATNVRARVQLPTGASSVSATSTSGVCSVAADVVTCATPALHTDSYVDITITATQPVAGNSALAASVEADQPDAVIANNTVTSDVLVVVPGASTGGGGSRGGGGGSISPWMLLALLLLSAARPVRRPRPQF
jgi:uncharacterized repeat protein (TIGR01451 family)